MLLQESFDGRFSDFSEEDRILAFLNPFSFTEDNIQKMPSQMKWNFWIYKQIRY